MSNELFIIILSIAIKAVVIVIFNNKLFLYTKMTDSLLILNEIRNLHLEVQNDCRNDEQKIREFWSCIETHSPKQLFKLILKITPNVSRELLKHPEFPQKLRKELDNISENWIEPLKKENQRIQQDNIQIETEINRYNTLIDEYKHQTANIHIINRILEGRINNYQQLISQII